MNKFSRIVHKMHGKRIFVVGDAMLDQYHFGRVDRVCPEAPVPVFVEDYEKAQTRRGGADHVAWQLEEWGCHVDTLFPKRRSAKHRYFVGQHLVFRRDSDSVEKSLPLVSIPECDSIVISDYGKGFVGTLLCREIMSLADGVPVIVDPKGSGEKYSGCTVICPNEKEFPDLDLPDCSVVHKRGENGMDVWFRGALTHIPAQARAVYDVTGAGDVVVAAIAAGLAAGASLVEAAYIASYAAGISVGKIGTSVATQEELLCALDSVTAASIDFTQATGTS